MGEADKRGWKRVLSEVRRVIVFFFNHFFQALLARPWL
jgi:hypothetical protein